MRRHRGRPAAALPWLEGGAAPQPPALLCAATSARELMRFIMHCPWARGVWGAMFCMLCPN